MGSEKTKPTLVDLEQAFADDRGSIQPLVGAELHDVALIRSNKGAVRANHYHKTDSHYCYVLSGSIEYLERPTGTEDEPRRTLVRAGEMFYTPPMVDHAMCFPEDTVFITMSTNPRDHETYESDLVRIKLV